MLLLLCFFMTPLPLKVLLGDRLVERMEFSFLFLRAGEFASLHQSSHNSNSHKKEALKLAPPSE